MSRVALLLAASLLAACGAIIGVDERQAGSPDAGADPETREPDPGPAVDGAAAVPGKDAGEGGAPLAPETLGAYVDPTLSLGETHVLILDRAGGRSKIVILSKANPTAPKTIYDEAGDTAANRVASIALARGKVWYTTVDRKLHAMGLDGKNPTDVVAPSSSILARSANTLWLIGPDGLSSAPTLRWLNQDLLSQIPEAQLAMSGPAMFAKGTDDELMVSSRTSQGRWTLSRWRPLATTPYVTFATFDAYPSWVTADAVRALVYQQDEGNIVSWSRVTPQATPDTVLTGVGAPVQIESDGKNIVLRSQSSIQSCVITSCAATMRTLTPPTSFAKARYLQIDDQYAYFFYAKTDTSTMTLARVPR